MIQTIEGGKKKKKSSGKRCVLFFPLSNTSARWFEVTGSHDVEAAGEKEKHIIKMWNLNKIP